MVSLPLKNHGILKLSTGIAKYSAVPMPKLRAEYILVKTMAVALNPTDYQTLDQETSNGARNLLVGCDYAGVVVEVGEGVEREWKIGDRIAGVAHGENELQPEDGTFAEYVAVKGDIALHIPPNISFEQAATLGCGLATVALGLYQKLSLSISELESIANSPTPLPDSESRREKEEEEKKWILIYGGSSATGTLAVQFAKLSGYTVITTASPHNFPLLKSLGADYVFDYHDPACGSVIHTLTANTLHLVLDTIATPSSASICASALSSNSLRCHYVNLMGVEFPRSEVKNTFFLGYTLIGNYFVYDGEEYPAAQEDFELGVRFMPIVERLLEKGWVRNHPIEVRGGLQDVIGGMDEMKKSGVSGKKLVYRVGEE